MATRATITKYIIVFTSAHLPPCSVLFMAC
jgi:hypothetical protein